MGFMNQELINIRDNLSCGHCCAVFVGSNSQARKVKYEKKTVYCSKICRVAALRKKFSVPEKQYGPCPTCGEKFFSKRKKVFCTLGCYTKSPQFLKMLEVNRKAFKNMPKEKRLQIAKRRRTGKYVQCLECKTEIYSKPSRPKKFCTKTCYRAYLAKRFDRWMANPEGLSLPQCYDEFLDSQELPCLVEGCDWEGKHLSLHANLAHGIQADELKRAAGFNLSTGVISRPLAEKLSLREKIGIAVNNEPPPESARIAVSKTKRYCSLEAKEHQAKTRALLSLEPGPKRICRQCKKTFQQTTKFGKTKYCSLDCRNKFYRETTQ